MLERDYRVNVTVLHTPSRFQLRSNSIRNSQNHGFASFYHSQCDTAWSRSRRRCWPTVGDPPVFLFFQRKPSCPPLLRYNDLRQLPSRTTLTRSLYRVPRSTKLTFSLIELYSVLFCSSLRSISNTITSQTPCTTTNLRPTVI